MAVACADFGGKHTEALTQLSGSVDSFGSQQYTRDPQAGDRSTTVALKHTVRIHHGNVHMSVSATPHTQNCSKPYCASLMRFSVREGAGSFVCDLPPCFHVCLGSFCGSDGRFSADTYF